MENWKYVRNVIIALAVLFSTDFIILIIMLPKPNVFLLGVLAVLAITAIYFTAISWMLLKRLVECEKKLKK